MSEIAINSSKKLGFFNSTKALSRSICSRSLPKVFIFSTEEGSRSTKKASGSNRRLTGPRMKKAERQPIVSAAQPPIMGAEIGRASCRERVYQYVEISVVAGTVNKKHKPIQQQDRNTSKNHEK